ncbi:MAG: hypothetical protein ABL962_08215 [Fimbriimonadaceae bacterium]
MQRLIRAIFILLMGVIGLCLVAFGILLTVKTSNSLQIAIGIGIAALGMVLAVFYVRLSPPRTVPERVGEEGKPYPQSPQRNEHPSRYERGIMMAALTMVAAFCGLFVFPVMASNRVAQGLAGNFSNVKQIGTAMAIYMSDYKDDFPPSNRWLTLIKPYGAEESHCFMSSSRYTYAMNDALSSYPAVSVTDPSSTVAIFEMKAQTSDAHGSQRDLDPHHGGGSVFGLVDTQAKFWKPGATTKIRWNP